MEWLFRTVKLHPYRPLNERRKEIRLLQLLPAAPNKIIQARSRIVSLIENPRYECISYCWGDSKHKKIIILDGRPVFVTPNLVGALRRFRRTDLDLSIWLWVDAVCIDQNNLAEKSSQVTMMSDIYRQAERVRAWLGAWPAFHGISTQSEQDKAAMEFMGACTVALKLFGDQTPPREDWILTPRIIEVASSFNQLMKGPYWRRMWITQELITNDQVDIYLGVMKCTLTGEGKFMKMCDNIRSAGETLLQAAERLETTVALSSTEQDQNPDTATIQIFRESSDLLQEALEVVLRLQAAEHLFRSGDFYDKIKLVLLIPFGSEATNPKDYVYAMMGMFPGSFSIEPDYSRDVTSEEVFADYTLNLMGCTADNAWLLAAASQKSSAPSWAIDFSKLTGNLWWCEYNSHYAAAKGIPSSFEVVVPHSKIKLTGVIIDEVSSSGILFDDVDQFFAEPLAPLLLTDLKAQGCSPQATGSAWLSAVTRTLVRDLEVQFESFTGTRETSRLTEEIVRQYQCVFELPFETMQPEQAALYLLIAMTLVGKRLVVTKTGYLCLVDANARHGDKICVVSRCNTPLCLRSSKATGGEIHHEVVGACYVDNMMDGQAFDLHIQRLARQGISWDDLREREASFRERTRNWVEIQQHVGEWESFVDKLILM